MDDILPFDYYVAESNLYYLMASFVFFWGMLLLIESRILGNCIRSMWSPNPGAQVQEFLQAYGVDEDVVEEENRVRVLDV